MDVKPGLPPRLRAFVITGGVAIWALVAYLFAIGWR